MSPYVHTTKLSRSTLAAGRSAQDVPVACVWRPVSVANANAAVEDLSNARRPSAPVPADRPIMAELLCWCRRASAPVILPRERRSYGPHETSIPAKLRWDPSFAEDPRPG